MMSEFCKVYVSPSLFVVLVRAAECVSKRVCVCLVSVIKTHLTEMPLPII